MENIKSFAFPSQAEREGYTAITIPYFLPEEQWMLDNVIQDMADADFALVGTLYPEVWRKL